MPLVSISPNIDIDLNKLAIQFGGKKKQDFSYAVSETVRLFSKKMSSMLAPKLYYRISKIDSAADGRIDLSSGIAFFSSKLSKVMMSCEEAVCFIATIGKDIDREIIRLTENNHLSDAYIFDVIGSVLVESIVNNFWIDMKKKYQKTGQTVSLRFSPGYCDWSVKGQQKLFHFFDLKPAFVKLNDSCLMSPRKSISGIFGISHPHTTDYVESYNPCRSCQKKDCAERRN
jgi:hypothetical protein